jgi:hypothetical protein
MRMAYGWEERLDIPSGLDRLWRRTPDRGSALITTIDSTDDVAGIDLVPLLAGAGIEHGTLGRAVVVGEAAVRRLIAEYDFFTGFDELWLFDAAPDETKPKQVRITSDRPFSEAPPPTVLEAWMLRTGCRLGLGDGLGLNWVCADPRVASLLSGN